MNSLVEMIELAVVPLAKLIRYRKQHFASCIIVIHQMRHYPSMILQLTKLVEILRQIKVFVILPLIEFSMNQQQIMLSMIQQKIFIKTQQQITSENQQRTTFVIQQQSPFD